MEYGQSLDSEDKLNPNRIETQLSVLTLDKDASNIIIQSMNSDQEVLRIQE